ncbi:MULTISPECIES: hypothetical protein [Delftia]|uniref:hypothetical protein n=1 Tax=Delftia TaxID=80865 RepID=UPI0012CCC842|nr:MULTISPECIES: hypothetical protein [Delftia]MPT03440.1 hypothetical protein [Delftia sp.]
MRTEELLNPPRPLPGWEDLGLFDTPKAGVLRLVRNQRTGVVMQMTSNGSLRGVAPSVAALVVGAPVDGDFSAYTLSFAPQSFDACSELLKASSGPVRDAARAVLVDGVPQAEAARMFGCFPQSLSRTIASYRRAMELAVVAVQGGR